MYKSDQHAATSFEFGTEEYGGRLFKAFILDKFNPDLHTVEVMLNVVTKHEYVSLTLQQVRDLHTFFAQLEEEMVRRMPAPAPVVEAVPEREPFPEPSPSDPQRGRPA